MIGDSATKRRNGKGSLCLNGAGETRSGEATRASANSTRGVASAAGSSGTFARCRYTMNTPAPGSGTGTGTFSTGATYPVHIGG